MARGSSIQWFRSLIENLEIFVIRVNASVIAAGGFAGNAESCQVLQRRGHRRNAEFQFLARTCNGEDRLGLKQPVNELKDVNQSFNCEAPN